MDVIPAIRAAQTARDGFSRLQELRAMSYADYLQTVEWRKRRDLALRRAGWKCERCPASRPLQVHHRTYERLGAEVDTDLEVLCQTCHDGHHFDEGRREYVDVYVKIVSDLLKGDTFESFSCLAADAKDRCAVLGIRYDGNRLDRAIAFLQTKRVRVMSAPVHQSSVEARLDTAPIGRQEATEICRRLGLVIPLRSVAAATWSDPDVYARELASREALNQDLA